MQPAMQEVCEALSNVRLSVARANKMKKINNLLPHEWLTMLPDRGKNRNPKTHYLLIKLNKPMIYDLFGRQVCRSLRNASMLQLYKQTMDNDQLIVDVYCEIKG